MIKWLLYWSSADGGRRTF